MTDKHLQDDGVASAVDDVSLFAVGNTLLNHRALIGSWMLVGAAFGVIPAVIKAPTYTSRASFMPQSGQDATRSGLANLAGQFGLQVGAGLPQGQSADFYVSLLKSRVILEPIVVDTFWPSDSSTGVTLLELLEIKDPLQARRAELGVAALAERIETNVAAKTGVVTVIVTTRWPRVSRDVAARLISGVNEFNLRTRQSQAAEERRFTEGRLAEARTTLREVEDRLQRFLQQNRQVENSPQLRFERDRLQREVALQQQIVASLAQSYEDVRIREVRDTPVITVVEGPFSPTQANPRGRAKRGIAGMLAGAFVAMVLAFTRDALRRRREAKDPDAEAFRRSLVEFKADLVRLLTRRRGGLGS